MSDINHAGNIIASLASLPEFLRKPILKKRMAEFPTLSAEEREEIISNALAAGPAIPFHIFSKLFETWLHIVAQMPADERRLILEGYAVHISTAPHKVVNLHMDGLLEIFRNTPPQWQGAISSSIRSIIRDMEPEPRKIILALMPDSARAMMGL